MARTMRSARKPSKRPSPAEDSDEEDARERVRIKKEKNDYVEPTRHVSEPAETQETNMTSQPAAEDSEDDITEDEEEINLDNVDDEDMRERWEFAQTHKNKYAGKIRDAGVIKSVTLTDFMCHRHLTADFGGKMNFLVGHNGSGKSAILTAISIAFGGKAASTGRGSSLRDLVMKGADKATISITLENQGTGAFEPETYNPYLVIERIINSTGSTAYKFRASRDGKVLADKRETLTRIVDRFGLHIDSPLTVLTQDQARSFLQSSDPKSLYRFFLQGTLLESLSNSYSSIGQQIKFFENLKGTEKDAIPELQQEADRLSRRAREIELVFSKRKDVDKLVAEMAWSYVHRGNKDAREAEADVAAKQKKLDDGIQKLEDNKKKVVEYEAQIKELDKAIQGFNDNEAPIKIKRESQRKKVAAIQKITAEMQGDIKKCEHAISLGAAEVEDYEARIQKKENTSQGKDPEVARLRGVIQQHQNLIANLKRTKPKVEQTITEAEEALAKAVAEENIATDVRMEASKAASDMGARIDNLKAQSGSRLNAFGHKMDLVMREIDRARWTAGKPIGPLGMHVSLTDHRYKDAFHSLMGQTLCLFAVLNDRDRSTMKEILIRCQRQGYCPGFAVGRGRAPVSVLQHSGDKFNYASGDLSHINDTILSKLEIDNDDVKRILVDKHQIERTFIWPQISGPNSVTHRVRELYQQGTKSCTFVTADMFNARGANGQDSSGPIQPYGGLPLLTKDVAQDIEDSRTEHVVLIRKRDESIEALTKANAETRKCKEALASAKRELEKQTNGLRKSEKQEGELADQLSEIEQADTGADLAELRRGAEARKRGEEEQLAQLQSEIEANQKIEREAKNLLKEIEAELEALAPQRTATIEATTVLAQDRAQAISHVEWHQGRVPAFEQILATAQAKFVDKEKQYQDFLSQALGMSKGVRIETNRPAAEINRLIKAAQAACQRIENETGDTADEIARQVVIANEKLTSAKERVIEMERLLQMFEIGLQNRRQFWTLERQHAAIACNSSFIGSMAKRSLDAHILFDHQYGHMLIKVRETVSQTQADPNGHTQVGPRQYKTPKTMSGGERSFTTVSLLLAMWQLSSSPMRCLDEWDVFLDPANRKVAAGMLLDGAKNSAETQFILITPQSMGGIDITGPGNKIIKLADPMRNQRTLDFQTQAQTQTQA